MKDRRFTMSKKALLTLSLIGTTLYSPDLMKTVFAETVSETNTPSALFERSSVKTATTTENLNLRDKASTSGKVLATIPKGKTVTLLSDRNANGWYKVTYDGKVGYASGAYLQENLSNTTSLGKTKENLNLRQQASTNGSILAIIPKGETINLLSDKDVNGWYKVSYLDKTGYVYGDYITKLNQGSTGSNNQTSSSSTPTEGQTTENLNLRLQANTSGSIITTIPKGTTVQVLADKDSNGWYKVSYAGKTGYVSGSYFKITKYSSTEVTKKTGYVYNLNGTLLNVRPKPSTSEAPIGTLTQGTSVVIVGESGNWYQIEFNNKTAYVSKDYITFTAPTPEVVKKTGYVYNLDGTLLNVRPKPSTSEAPIGTLAQGTSVVIVGESGNWYQIEFNNKTAYVSKDYITFTAPTPEVVKKTGYVYNLDGTLLNVRPKPSTSEAPIGTLTQGTSVVIVGESGNWYQIEFNNKTAYVSKDYITFTAPTPEVVKKTGYVYNLDGALLNVRPKPSTSETPIGTLTQGTSVVITGETGNWYHIEFNNTTAYVSKDYITFTAPTPEVVKKTGYVYNLDGALLNVRPKPSTWETPIGTLTQGSSVVIVGESGNWYEIEYNNSTAYVSKDYVTLTAPQLHPDANIDFSKTPRTGVVIDGISSLNIRQAPTTNSSILGTLKSKDEVTVIGREGNFYKISYQGAEAYVHKDYVGIKASSTTINGRVSYLTTQYNYTLSQFAQIQQNHTSGTLSTIMNYLNPNHTMHSNYLLQFLRIDQFRSFNVDGLNKFLQNKGVLHNQAQAIYDAAKYYNIDPIFLVSQSIHETNWGSSNLAKGITITDIADETKPIKDANGKVVDYERILLPEPVTVYNLFGIGAQDHAPRLLGTTYAYKRGWTTPEKAIFGAAEFISLNYINSSKYAQNTPFKIKYNHISANQWHQYATTPWYAYEIGKYMHQFAHLYDTNQEFLLDIPVYK